MNYTIKNDFLSVSIESRGAEMTSIKSADGTEYLWQGNPDWPGHAPNLFPMVGRLTDNSYIMDGEKHTMHIHGFLAWQEMEVTENTDSAITFTALPTDVTRQIYDREFKASVRFALVENQIEISFSVVNNDTRVMYFGYGGHPGFNVPMSEGLKFEDYYLEFGNPCQPVSIGLTPTCFIGAPNLPLHLVDDQKLPLRHNLFDNDALVLQAMDKAVTIKSDKDSRSVTVRYPQMPYLGIWHLPKQEVDYVCIEPWMTLPAHQDVIEVFEEKLDNIVLAPGKTYVNNWDITIR